MNSFWRNTVGAVGAIGALVAALPASALPLLQLDIPGATYVGADPDAAKADSAVTMDNQFTLYAYGTPQGQVTATDLLTREYLLSIAVTPQQTESTPGPDLGSFKIGTTTVNVTGDMVFGTPPIETLGFDQGHDSGDLSTHGVFDTYFTEVLFQFAAGDDVTPFDMQGAGQVVPDFNGTGMFYKAFELDLSALVADVNLHFDLYDAAAAKKDPNDIDANDNAPFSHDATTMRTPPGPGPGPGPNVDVLPEPATLLLAGLGIAGLTGRSLRRGRKRAA